MNNARSLRGIKTHYLILKIIIPLYHNNYVETKRVLRIF